MHKAHFYFVLLSCLMHLYFGCGWLVVLRINVDLAVFQPYLNLEAGDNSSLKIQVARPGIEPRSSCSASQELPTTTPIFIFCKEKELKFMCIHFVFFQS